MSQSHNKHASRICGTSVKCCRFGSLFLLSTPRLESALSPVLTIGYVDPEKVGKIRSGNTFIGALTKIRRGIWIGIVLILKQWAEEQTSKAGIQIQEHRKRGIQHIHRVNSSVTDCKWGRANRTFNPHRPLPMSFMNILISDMFQSPFVSLDTVISVAPIVCRAVKDTKSR
jgi:hypothetical protein